MYFSEIIRNHGESNFVVFVPPPPPTLTNLHPQILNKIIFCIEFENQQIHETTLLHLKKIDVDKVNSSHKAD